MSKFGLMQSENNLPMDSVSGWLGAWSLIKLKASYTGTVCNVRRSSDNSTTDIYHDTNGRVSTSSLVSAGGNLGTWAGASTHYVTSYTDLTGNGRHAVQATTAYQPQLVLNALNGNAVIRFSGGQALYLSSPLNTDLNSFFSLHNIASSAARGVIFGNYQVAGNTQNSAVEKNSSNFFRVFYNSADLCITTSNAFGQIRVGSFVRNTSLGITWAFINNALARTENAVNGNVTNDLPHGMGADQRNANPAGAIPLTGDVSCILAHNNAFSSAQRAQVIRSIGRLGGLNI